VGPVEGGSQAEKEEVVQRQDKNGGEIEAKKGDDAVVLEDGEGFGRGGGLSAEDEELNDGGKGVEDEDEGGDTADAAEAGPRRGFARRWDDDGLFSCVRAESFAKSDRR
jgi:hypothetical protein